MSALTLTIGRRLKLEVADLAAAQAAYDEARETSGEGASTFPEGRVRRGGKAIARISYNGRAWEPGVKFDRRNPTNGLLAEGLGK